MILDEVCKDTMESVRESGLCTGCAACSQSCPQGAIDMAENDEGFLYPGINSERCNDCGLCRKICPVNVTAAEDSKIPETENSGGHRAGSTEEHKAYACFSKDNDIRAKSSSGGIFSHLALDVLSRGGIVFGAGFDENFRVRHCYIESTGDIDSLRRSKYVQSDTCNTFRETKDFLTKGKEVLYCGTPCQIAGLKAFLNKDYENLLTCDLACSGVPSPKVWRMYLDYLCDKYKSKIASVSFRDKSEGWADYKMKIVFKNGSWYSDRAKRELFFIGFGKNIFNRSSCFNCKFRLSNTKADITLADFWGVSTLNDKDFMDNKGVSLLITNTDKGERALFKMNDKMLVKPEPLEIAARYNPRLVFSVAEPAKRKSFFDDMRAGHDFNRLRQKYMDNSSIKYKIKCMLKKIIGRNVSIGRKGRYENKAFHI